jgi:hypothetical protein
MDEDLEELEAQYLISIIEAYFYLLFKREVPVSFMILFDDKTYAIGLN